MKRFEIWVTNRPARKAANGKTYFSFEKRYESDNFAQIDVLWRGLNIGLGYRAKLVQGLTILARKGN